MKIFGFNLSFGAKAAASDADIARERLGIAGRPTPARQGAAANETATVVAAGTTIDGNISAAGPVEIRGEVKGDVRAEHVVVQAGGRVQGQIQTSVLIVMGSVDGNINASHITLKSGALVNGDMLYEAINTEHGSVFNGKSSHRDTGRRPAQRTSAQQGTGHQQLPHAGHPVPAHGSHSQGHPAQATHPPSGAPASGLPAIAGHHGYIDPVEARLPPAPTPAPAPLRQPRRQPQHQVDGAGSSIETYREAGRRQRTSAAGTQPRHN